MISIIVPIFNEEKAVNKISSKLKRIKFKKQLIFINDGSTDRTLEKLKKIKKIKLINNKKNIGYGASIKKGIKKAKYDLCLTIDADDTYPINKIKSFIDYSTNKNNLIIGNRLFVESKFTTLVLRKLLKVLIYLITLNYNKDPNSGMRLFSKKFISKYLHLCSDGFSFSTSTSLIYGIKKEKIDFINIIYKKRIGTTKVKIFRDMIRTLKQIFIIVIKI
tara:strand:+ start:188 stop:844 length:657 start_codon:yes stop_codon:yes gene_type:complete